MATPELRKIKLAKILRSVEVASERGLAVQKRLLFAEITNEWGTSWKVFKEYLRVLVDLQQIVIVEEDIWSIKRWHKIQLAESRDYLKKDKESGLDKFLSEHSDTSVDPGQFDGMPDIDNKTSGGASDERT